MKLCRFSALQIDYQTMLCYNLPYVNVSFEKGAAAHIAAF